MSDRFPAWYYGPNNVAEIFETEDDIPAGWMDHPDKVSPETTGSKPLVPLQDDVPEAQRGAAPVPAGSDVTPAQSGNAPSDAQTTDQSNTLDRDGWPWTAEYHVATMAQTGQGLWRMKPGVTRPDPKPGYPLPDQSLDL